MAESPYDDLLSQLDLSEAGQTSLRSLASSPEELAAVDEAISALLAHASPAGWALRATRDDADPFCVPPHIKLLDAKLVQLVSGTLVHSRTGLPCTKLMVTMPPRHGKQTRTDEPVLTTAGWTTAGRIVMGDQVFGVDGSPTTVVAVSPVDVAAPKMRVGLSDGSSVDVHPCHEWTVYDRARAGWRTIDTAYLASQAMFAGDRCRFQLPARGALAMPAADLGIAPYLFGRWLGDGNAAAGCVCMAAAEEPEFMAFLTTDGDVLSGRSVHKDTGVVYLSVDGLYRRLGLLGVRRNKHIPTSYLLASEPQRRLLLAGIVDSDGHVDPAGRVRVVSGDRRLADDIELLVRSLGYNATTWAEVDSRPSHFIGQNEVQTAGTRFVVGWTPMDGLGQGRMERKVRPRFGVQRRIGIVSVETAAPADGLCIQVAAEDGLFLVGRDLIPTHNSELCSKYLCAWYLSRWPNRRIILASYEADFAAGWGQASRDLVEQNSWCGVEVRKDSRAGNDWKLVGHAGRMVTAGIGGPTTGKGATLFIIDDPVKNKEEADSPTFRERNWKWYLTTARTRLQRPAPGSDVKPVQLVIQTRWHEDDLAGRLLEAEGDAWEVIDFPALAEDDDVLGRAPGDALWPEMFDRETLEETRALDGATFDALYQQHPFPEGGGQFNKDDFRYWEYGDSGRAYILEGTNPVPVKDCLRFITVDLAASLRTRADWTVLSVWDMTRTSPSNLILVDRIRVRVETPEHLPLLERVLDSYKAQWAGIEKATYGLALLQAAQRRGLKTRELKADRDKVSRAMNAADLNRRHRLFFPRGAGWLSVWEHEVVAFPGSTHDDQVDTLAYAADVVAGRDHADRKKKAPHELTLQEKAWLQIKRNRDAGKIQSTLGKGF